MIDERKDLLCFAGDANLWVALEIGSKAGAFLCPTDLSQFSTCTPFPAP